jgi:hypothetical protein
VEGVRVEGDEMVAPGDPALHEAGALEDADVLRYRVERDVEGRRDLRHARLALAQAMEDRAPRVVGQRGEDGIEEHRHINQMGEYAKDRVNPFACRRLVQGNSGDFHVRLPPPLHLFMAIGAHAAGIASRPIRRGSACRSASRSTRTSTSSSPIPGAREAKLKQVRVFAQAADEAVLERRILWGPALADLGKAASVAPGAQGSCSTLRLFSALKRATRLRYELEFEGRHADGPLRESRSSVVPRRRARATVEAASWCWTAYDILSHHRRWSWIGPRARRSASSTTTRGSASISRRRREGVDVPGDGKRNEDWLTWGRPVRAAGWGRFPRRTTSSRTTTRSAPRTSWTSRSPIENEMTSYGNYVLIDHENGEFSLVGHLQRGSLKVKKGDRVKGGRCHREGGNSGSSLGPHVHYELRTGWGVRGVRSMAARFADLRMAGVAERRSIGGHRAGHRRHRAGAVGPRPVAAYSGVIFESLITFAHFAVSSL